MTELKALGRTTSYIYDRVAPELLERFPSPAADSKLNPSGTAQSIFITTSEWSALCPITSQPDWATINVTYTPDKWCVESKSWKLYLGSYRMVGMFHEACVNKMLNDLVVLLEPLRVEVQGRFLPRGGISFWPTSTYTKKGEQR